MCNRIEQCHHMERDEEAATRAFEKLQQARRGAEYTREIGSKNYLAWKNRIAICTMVLAAIAPQLLREVTA